MAQVQVEMSNLSSIEIPSMVIEILIFNKCMDDCDAVSIHFYDAFS